MQPGIPWVAMIGVPSNASVTDTVACGSSVASRARRRPSSAHSRAHACHWPSDAAGERVDECQSGPGGG